ncbi:bacterial alpha-L-rhamnosidase-domain-containing protein [Cadophora sp. MPI-SDFR-AT-0126]|nr:bacterial alpha-L-rhamnosidase-domain-containing protein [Leotiomycetes sp. MPI-SDFR-AT-0126]
MTSIIGVQFEHYRPPNTLGIHETNPRLSWRYSHAPDAFQQAGYEIELSEEDILSHDIKVSSVKCVSNNSTLVPWPQDQALTSRQKISVRIRAWGSDDITTPWSDYARLEVGLLNRADWQYDRIAAPWGPGTLEPDPEQLYRKEFVLDKHVVQARLYITAQGVYEAELNGQRIGDHFLSPGWTAYDGRLQYQTYDVTAMLSEGANCLGVRVAEGWFSGRIGFAGGHRNIWGPHTALMAQLEIIYPDGDTQRVLSDGSWTVKKGPIAMAEIYDGEKYDATKEVPGWSKASQSLNLDSEWQPVLLLPPLPDTTNLAAGFSEPVRRTEVIKPIGRITSPSGKTIIDFGQNLVGYVRLSNIKGPPGHEINLNHAEVLENGELGIRPLRICKAMDQYKLSGLGQKETYEPRFTFHGFRYVQIDGWSSDDDLLYSIEAVVCHTDMKSAGSFSCSDPLLNKLYANIVWGMRGNFLSVPTDCPQRDERLGYSGDIALFAPTATLIYDCFNMLKNWLVDVEHDQRVLGGVPAMVTPNATLPDPVWCRRKPCAIWHDVTVLLPWTLYEETGDPNILVQQYNSMTTWMSVIPKNDSGRGQLWDPSIYQLGDWLDPAAPSDAPQKGMTDAKMVANAFLIHSLDLMVKIAGILGQATDQAKFDAESQAARREFQDEYVTRNGRLVSDSQTAYALAICFDLLTPGQRSRAGTRLVELVRKNDFKIGTGFAGTPYVAEALALTGHIQVAYSMLLERKCPSWLYPVTMGATTVWERWDSMLPDGSINPGEMTSFNHYAFGAIAKFLYERIAGLERLEAGWKRIRVAPAIGAEFTQASASHVTPRGVVSCSWTAGEVGLEACTMKLDVSVPYGTSCEVVMPDGEGEKREIVGPGSWAFETTFRRVYEWPVLALGPKT